MLPIQYPKVYEMYKKHVASFWTAEAGDISSPGILIRSSSGHDSDDSKKGGDSELHDMLFLKMT